MTLTTLPGFDVGESISNLILFYLELSYFSKCARTILKGIAVSKNMTEYRVNTKRKKIQISGLARFWTKSRNEVRHLDYDGSILYVK